MPVICSTRLANASLKSRGAGWVCANRATGSPFSSKKRFPSLSGPVNDASSSESVPSGFAECATNTTVRPLPAIELASIRQKVCGLAPASLPSSCPPFPCNS